MESPAPSPAEPKPRLPVRPAPSADPTDPAVLATAQGSDPPAEPVQDEGPVHHAGGFFNQPWVQNVLPLATSLALHLGIIVLGIALYQAVKQVANPNKEQVIIPESKSLTKSATPGGVPHPGPPADPTRDAMQDQTKTEDDTGFSTDAANKLASAAGGPSDNEASGFLGSNAAGGKGKSFGSGAGGGTAPWGMPGGGGGLLPKSNFMGTGGNANDVIFLCDASGSMVSVFGQLKQELKTSISQMSVDENGAQKFNVIFFSDENAFALFGDGMHIATPENKRKATEFIDNQVSVGGTQPIKAIRMAMAEHPQLLYVLTDGFDQIADMSTVTNAFKQGDPDGKTHVNCIFLQSDEDPKLVQALKQIADIGHGDMKIILKKDM